ncbi:MAG: LacI family DNA-binding transcriptional regulator [Actinobacteria bacterium]|nr:LacI family DNA-binding transcriptional regulator [Actinomycetota bacterium]
MPKQPPVRRPKLAHVAMAAGVSLGTASDALRGKGRMSDEVRSRVIAAAESMGYRPNANARILALGHSQIVALVAHGPDSTAAPRVYWPKLQAAFTERLLEQGMVACTMTLDDLNKLDGLPFDLIVHAGPNAAADLPPEIRSHYRVLDLDLTGGTPFARRLHAEFDATCRAALDHLIISGSSRPALVFAGSIGKEFRQPYGSWCDEHELPPIAIDAGAPDAADELARCLRSGVDGLLAVMTDTKWLDRMLTEGNRTDPEAFPVVVFGAPPEGDLGGRRFRMLHPDGRDLGLQLADVAVAFLRGESPPLLTPQFLLDGQPFP